MKAIKLLILAAIASSSLTGCASLTPEQKQAFGEALTNFSQALKAKQAEADKHHELFMLTHQTVHVTASCYKTTNGQLYCY